MKVRVSLSVFWAIYLCYGATENCCYLHFGALSILDLKTEILKWCECPRSGFLVPLLYFIDPFIINKGNSLRDLSRDWCALHRTYRSRLTTSAAASIIVLVFHTHQVHLEVLKCVRYIHTYSSMIFYTSNALILCFDRHLMMQAFFTSSILSPPCMFFFSFSYAEIYTRIYRILVCREEDHERTALMMPVRKKRKLSYTSYFEVLGSIYSVYEIWKVWHQERPPTYHTGTGTAASPLSVTAGALFFYPSKVSAVFGAG